MTLAKCLCLVHVVWTQCWIMQRSNWLHSPVLWKDFCHDCPGCVTVNYDITMIFSRWLRKEVRGTCYIQLRVKNGDRIIWLIICNKICSITFKKMVWNHNLVHMFFMESLFLHFERLLPVEIGFGISCFTWPFWRTKFFTPFMLTMSQFWLGTIWVQLMLLCFW